LKIRKNSRRTGRGRKAVEVKLLVTVAEVETGENC
jgi:hypothetical protein